MCTHVAAGWGRGRQKVAAPPAPRTEPVKDAGEQVCVWSGFAGGGCPVVGNLAREAKEAHFPEDDRHADQQDCCRQPTQRVVAVTSVGRTVARSSGVGGATWLAQQA